MKYKILMDLIDWRKFNDMVEDMYRKGCNPERIAKTFPKELKGAVNMSIDMIKKCDEQKSKRENKEQVKEQES